MIQKILAAGIDSFIENPTTPAGTNKNLKVIVGLKKPASELMFNDLSNLTVGQFKEKMKIATPKFNTLARSIMSTPIKSSKEEKSPNENSEIPNAEGQTLSSLLFTRVDNNDLSKGYKAKRDEPGSKSSSIKQNLANLTATMTDIDPSGDLNKPSSINKKGRKQMMTYLSRLHKDLDGIKIESKLSDSEIILERWNRLAGLEN